MSRLKYGVLTVSVFGVNYFVDYFTKQLAIQFLRGQPPTGFCHNLLILAYTENTGAFLSLGASWPAWIKILLFLVFPFILCIMALVYLFVKETHIPRILALASITAGGMANIIDRINNHFVVVDFLNFGVGGFRTGVLNTADLSVTIGVVCLFIYECRRGNS